MAIQRRPPLVVRIPNRELGPASGPFPALRIASEGTTRVKIVTAGTAEPGRVSQRRSWGTEGIGMDRFRRDTNLGPKQAPTGGGLVGGIRINLDALLRGVPVLGPVIARTAPPLVQLLPPRAPAPSPIAQPQPTGDAPSLDDLQASGGKVRSVDPVTGRATIEVPIVGGRTRTIDVDLPFPDVGFPERESRGDIGVGGETRPSETDFSDQGV